MYANKTNTNYKQAFQDKYEHCIRLFISTITEVQQLIIDLKTTTEKKKTDNIINRIINFLFHTFLYYFAQYFTISTMNKIP